jgi:hypothetical protein
VFLNQTIGVPSGQPQEFTQLGMCESMRAAFLDSIGSETVESWLWDRRLRQAYSPAFNNIHPISNINPRYA